MNGPDDLAELYELAGAQCLGALTADQTARLEELVLGDAPLRRHYILYMQLHAAAEYREAGSKEAPELRGQGLETDVGSAVELPNQPDENQPDENWQAEIPDLLSPIPPIILDLSPAGHHSLLASLVSPGGFLFSYIVGAVLVVIGLLAGWSWKISRDYERQVAVSPAPRPPAVAESKGASVGRITGMVDCRWADPKTEALKRDEVPLGRKYALASGFMEITYNSGARVVLQGPAAYEVESAQGGYLSLGRLTARVDNRESVVGVQRPGAKGERTANPTPSQRGMEPTASLAPRPSSHERGEGRGERGEEFANRKSEITNQKSPNLQSLVPNPLFSVRTPTAVVTDLGTEFGVEVDRSGTSRAHVFQGRVEVRPTAGDAHVIPLGRNETATVEAGRSGPRVKVTREANRSGAPGFVRRMPRQVRIKVFSTGVGLNEGDSDPHWQVVARNDQPNFKPRPAVVTVVDPRYYLANDPARSQWISTGGGLPNLPRAVFTFRTTFELADALPETAVLQGWFLADNHVEAVRLNGTLVSVPEHGTIPPFDQRHSFTARKGFVAGTNVLEIDVYNLPTSQGEGTPMALAVELEGFTLRGGHIATETDRKEAQPMKQ